MLGALALFGLFLRISFSKKSSLYVDNIFFLVILLYMLSAYVCRAIGGKGQKYAKFIMVPRFDIWIKYTA